MFDAIDSKLAGAVLLEVGAVKEGDAAVEGDGLDDSCARGDGAFRRTIANANRCAFEPRAFDRAAHLLGDGQRRHPDEFETLHKIEQLALCGGRKSSADFVERALQRFDEWEQPELGRPTPQGDEQRGFSGLKPEDFGGTPMSIFAARDPDLAGALVKDARRKPSSDGALVYLNVNGKLEAVVDRIASAGGEVLVPKMDIGEPGFIALFRDTEGNVVGLHSERAAR